MTDIIETWRNAGAPDAIPHRWSEDRTVCLRCSARAKDFYSGDPDVSTCVPLVCHVLRAGRALCGLPGTPNTWDAGHLWVSAEDGPKLASCRPCLRVLEQERSS